MKEKTKELGNSNVLFDFYGKRPEMSQLVPLSLQHVLAAIVGVITPSMIIAGVCGLTDAEKTMMIQAALIFTALATFLQLFPLFHKVGATLPVIMGTSFAYVPTLFRSEWLPLSTQCIVINGITMILAGNETTFRAHHAYRLVVATMTIFELVYLSTTRFRQ